MAETKILWSVTTHGEIAPHILKSAVDFFSSNYGVWGSLAPKPGTRVKMSPKVLQEQCVPTGAHTIYIRMLVNDVLVGHVFATRWTHGEEQMCWITQLCVSSTHRNQGVAKRLLQEVRQSWPGATYGILSSHPFAISAFLRVFDRGVENVHFGLTKNNARAIMESCPVPYVSAAKLHGSIFENVTDGSVSCADTGFLVDHEEPLAALRTIQEKGIEWPFGKLPEGHENLILAKGNTSM